MFAEFSIEFPTRVIKRSFVVVESSFKGVFSKPHIYRSDQACCPTSSLSLGTQLTAWGNDQPKDSRLLSCSCMFLMAQSSFEVLIYCGRRCFVLGWYGGMPSAPKTNKDLRYRKSLRYCLSQISAPFGISPPQAKFKLSMPLLWSTPLHWDNDV